MRIKGQIHTASAVPRQDLPSMDALSTSLGIRPPPSSSEIYDYGLGSVSDSQRARGRTFTEKHAKRKGRRT